MSANEEESSKAARTVIVGGIEEDIAEVVEVFLESPKYDGGAIEDFLYDKDKATALVIFEDSKGTKHAIP